MLRLTELETRQAVSADTEVHVRKCGSKRWALPAFQLNHSSKDSILGVSWIEMKTIFSPPLVVVFLWMTGASAGGQEAPLDIEKTRIFGSNPEKGELAEFAAVRSHGDKLLITMKQNGVKFLYGIEEKGVIAPADYKSVEYGQTLEIPFDRVTVFLDRHQSLKFEPSGIGRLRVSRTLDFRSLRRGIKVETFTLTAHGTGVVEFGEMTTKPLLQETELIKLAAISIKDKIEIPEGAKAKLKIKNGVAVVTWPIIHGSKLSIAPGADYYAQVKLDAMTGEVISILAGS